MRGLLLLPLALSPAYAIGFWGSLGGGLGFGGAGAIAEKDAWVTYVDGDTIIDTLEFEADASPQGFLPVGNLMLGLSFQPIPIAVGVGVDFAGGTQRYKIKAFNMVFEGTLNIMRIYVKLPVAYQLSLPAIKGLLGVYPAYASYSLKSKSEKKWSRFGGFAFGGFANLYYPLGPIGLGGGIFFDYGPNFKGSVPEDDDPFKEAYLRKVLHYGINVGIFASTGILE